MATTKTNEMKFTLWTKDGLRMDVPSGSISACVIMAFESIAPSKTRSASENREMALKMMTKYHEDLKAGGL